MTSIPPTEKKTRKHLRLKTLREKCLECQADNAAEVRRCEHADCSLHPWRMGKRPSSRTPGDTPRKAARQYCLWCCCNSPGEVRRCHLTGCALWAHRPSASGMSFTGIDGGVNTPADDVFSEMDADCAVLGAGVGAASEMPLKTGGVE